MLEIIGPVLAGAGAVGIPLLTFVLKLQGRLVTLETWREVTEQYRNGFERRILEKLDALEEYLRKGGP